MDEQAPTEQRGRLGIALSELGAHVEVALAQREAVAARSISSVRFERAPTPDEVIERLGTLVEQAGVSSLAQVGVAAWDQVDPVRGEVTDARYGAAWAGYPFAERLAARLRASARLVSGAHASARAEAFTGAAVGRSPALYVHLGRVVASALIVDGEPLVGAHHAEGQLHHWQTGLDGPACVCGARSHLGPLASAQGLVRLAIGVASQDDATLAAVHRVTHGRAEALTAPQVAALASEGVQPLRELLDYSLDALAGALANLTLALDPAVVVLGGPLAQADPVYFAWLQERVSARLVGAHAAPEIIPARLGAHAAVIGAASLAAR